MSRNGSGVQTSPAADYPAVATTLIQSTKFNNVIDDINVGITGSIAADGQTTVTANLPMNSKKFTGLADGSSRTDSSSLGQLQDLILNWVAAGGTVDVITATYSPSITALVDGQVCCFRASGANTSTAPTFAPNGLTARTIFRFGDQALVAGDIRAANHEVILRYHLATTRWELLNPATAVAATTATTATNQSGGTVSATTISASSTITSTYGNNAHIFNSSSATTGYQYADIRNTSGLLRFGIEGSTGGSLITGNTAYDAIFSSKVGISFSTDDGASVGARLSTSGFTTKYGITSSSSTAGIGHTAGAGGTVTQITSNTTSVTRDKICGQIITVSGGSWAPNTRTSFICNNSTCGLNDIPVICFRNGAQDLSVNVTTTGVGYFEITIANLGSSTVIGQVTLSFQIKPNVIA